jgi:hypothetical protein
VCFVTFLNLGLSNFGATKTLFMKRNFLHSLLFAAAVITLASCGDDDDGPSNNFSYNGTSKGVTTGEIYLDEDGETVNGKTVYFHNISLSNIEGASQSNPLAGKFSGIEFSLSSFSKTVTAGKYTFSGSTQTGKELEITDGSVYMDMTFENIDESSISEFVSGTATVAVSGDTYTIDAEGTAAIDGEAANAKAFKIHYSGKLESMN